MGVSKQATENKAATPARDKRTSANALRCRRKFLRFFPDGFRDETYLDWERDYKWQAHERWNEALGRAAYGQLLRKGEFSEIAARRARRVAD